MTPGWTVDDLKKFQDRMMESGKQILIQDKFLLPTFFVLTRKMELDPWLRGHVLDVTTMRRPEKMDEAPGEFIILVIPSDWNDAKTLQHMIKYMFNDPTAMEHDMDVMRKSVKSLGLDDDRVDEAIVEAFKRVTGMSAKDIIASFVKVLCKKTDAIAYVQVCEAWVKEGTNDKSDIPTDLSNDVEAEEVLMCAMETKLNYSRFIREHFTRTERGKGDIIGWGKKEVLEDNGNSGQFLTGRFFGLIRGDR
jgi:hypothetical protein